MAARAELKDIAAYIAKDNPAAARKILAPLRATGFAPGARANGRPGRVSGTHEESVVHLPYVIPTGFEVDT